MIRPLINNLRKAFGTSENRELLDQLVIETRIAAGFARGAATAAQRRPIATDPRSWEFGGFSQHGEDGILGYLISNLSNSDRCFLEIAGADGLENCTAWLALAHKWSGVMVEGDAQLAACCRKTYRNRVWNVSSINAYVTLDNLASILDALPTSNFDVLSLDIDSVDFHILKSALAGGARPKIIVVEYNSAFGPEASVTVPYKNVFDRWKEHESGVYYGASLGAWKNLLERYRYRFVTVETSGTNAFFVDPQFFPVEFLAEVRGIQFLNNATDINPTTATYHSESGFIKMSTPDWKRQIELIRHLPLEQVISGTE